MTTSVQDRIFFTTFYYWTQFTIARTLFKMFCRKRNFTIDYDFGRNLSAPLACYHQKLRFGTQVVRTACGGQRGARRHAACARAQEAIRPSLAERGHRTEPRPTNRVTGNVVTRATGRVAARDTVRGRPRTLSLGDRRDEHLFAVCATATDVQRKRQK